MFRPIDFNYKGYDLYFFDRLNRVFYAIQISISSDPAKQFLDCLAAMNSDKKACWKKYLDNFKAFRQHELLTHTCSCALHHMNDQHPLQRSSSHELLPIEFAYVYLGPLKNDDWRLKEKVLASGMGLFDHVLDL